MRLPWLALLGIVGFVAADSNDTQQGRPLSAFIPPQHFRNVNLVRNINLDKSYARETINVVIENIDGQPQSDYFLAFEAGSASRVGGVDVKDKKNPENVGFNVRPAPGETEVYQVTLPAPLPPKEQQTLSITYYTLSALKPRPAEIEQNDKQYVEYSFSAYVPSAYTTLKQKTKLKLASTDIPDASVVPAELNLDGKVDPQKQGSTFTYGPYGEQKPGAEYKTTVRYEFTHPLTHGSRLERDVEVSHWGGNVATEERHWLTNRGATLKNHFSRVAYQQAAYYKPPSSALKELRFPLPIGSIDAYFVDDIGNVSTSRFRTNPRESNLELKPRYPLFGGWNYSFKTGWNADLRRVLRTVKGKSDSYVLKVPFFEGPKQSEGVEYEEVIVRIILPEGASNVKYETDLTLVSDSISLHKTFMDTVGRTTLTLTATNLVDELRDHDLIVTYDYTRFASLRKPLVLFAGLLFVFAVSWVVGNLDVSIGKKQKAN